MKVQLEKTFRCRRRRDAAWALLQDIEARGRLHARRARSPSASTTSTTRARWPSSSARRACRFAARSRSGASSPPAQTLRLAGKGTDTTGSSGASMDLTARVEAVDARVVQPGGHQRGVDERQGRDLRRPHDGLGGRPGAQAVRRQLRGQVQAMQAQRPPAPAGPLGRAAAAPPPTAADGLPLRQGRRAAAGSATLPAPSAAQWPGAGLGRHQGLAALAVRGEDGREAHERSARAHRAGCAAAGPGATPATSPSPAWPPRCC